MTIGGIPTIPRNVFIGFLKISQVSDHSHSDDRGSRDLWLDLLASYAPEYICLSAAAIIIDSFLEY